MNGVRRRSAGDASRLDRFALRSDSVGIHRVFLPNRALPAGRLTGLGAHLTPSTDR